MRRVVKGFTLIEVLIALAVFGIMSAIAYTTLGLTFTNAEMISERMDRLQAIQRTMRYLTQDLTMASPRPVRDELGQNYLPALMVEPANDFVLAVTHGGWANPAGLPRGTLQRSIYVLEEDRLMRVYFTVLDATYTNNPVSTEILDGVLGIEFNMLQDDNQNTNVWPPVNASGQAAQTMRPRAVEIVLTLEDEGEIRRIVEVAP